MTSKVFITWPFFADSWNETPDVSGLELGAKIQHSPLHQIACSRLPHSALSNCRIDGWQFFSDLFKSVSVADLTSSQLLLPWRALTSPIFAQFHWSHPSIAGLQRQSSIPRRERQLQQDDSSFFEKRLLKLPLSVRIIFSVSLFSSDSVYLCFSLVAVNRSSGAAFSTFEALLLCVVSCVFTLSASWHYSFLAVYLPYLILLPLSWFLFSGCQFPICSN